MDWEACEAEVGEALGQGEPELDPHTGWQLVERKRLWTGKWVQLLVSQLLKRRVHRSQNKASCFGTLG